MVARVTGRSLEEERHLPNPNQTDVRWGLGGTDLGIIWEIAPGRYGLFFGDSYGPDFVPVAGGGPGRPETGDRMSLPIPKIRTCPTA